MRTTPIFAALLWALVPACGSTGDGSTEGAGDPAGPGDGPGGKADSGWLGNTTFEVDATFRSVVQHEASGQWADLATSEELQFDLIDLQVKFAKNATEAQDYRINQLIDSVDRADVRTEEGVVVIEYEATVDMLRPLWGDVPTLEELDPRTLSVRVPLDPVDVYARGGRACAPDDHASGYNVHYYFDPDGEGCSLELHTAEIEVVEVFGRPTVYPEYDQLMLEREEGRLGFSAAIVPARGDNDPMSRFDAHQRMIEDELELAGTESEDGSYTRYEWVRGDVEVVVDLFDPTESYFTTSFRSALRTYELVWYNGHSAYGTQSLLTDPEAFSDRYQVLGLHSCQSYAYYVQQAFRAKATAEDPDGFVLTDFVATGRSSYPSGSPRTLSELLEGLMDGIAAVREGRREDATDWLTIVERMNRREPGIQYGVAGVRTNTWRP